MQGDLCTWQQKCYDMEILEKSAFETHWQRNKSYSRGSLLFPTSSTYYKLLAVFVVNRFGTESLQFKSTLIDKDYFMISWKAYTHGPYVAGNDLFVKRDSIEWEFSNTNDNNHEGYWQSFGIECARQKGGTVAGPDWEIVWIEILRQWCRGFNSSRVHWWASDMNLAQFLAVRSTTRATWINVPSSLPTETLSNHNVLLISYAII